MTTIRRQRLGLKTGPSKSYSPSRSSTKRKQQRKNTPLVQHSVHRASPEEYLMYNRLEKLFQGRPRVLEIKIDFISQQLYVLEHQVRKVKPYGVKSVFAHLSFSEAVRFTSSLIDVSGRTEDRGIVPVGQKLNDEVPSRNILSALLYTSENRNFAIAQPLGAPTYFLFVEKFFREKSKSSPYKNFLRLIVAKNFHWFEAIISRKKNRYKRYQALLPNSLQVRRSKKKLRFLFKKTQNPSLKK
jgi:hypothetical protein